MLLPVVAGLVLLGLIVWTLGEIFAYRGIAALGGVIVIVAGAAVLLTGIEVRTGTIADYSYTQLNNTTVRDAATIDYQYGTTALAEVLDMGAWAPLGFGGLLLFLGTTLLSQTLAQGVDA